MNSTKLRDIKKGWLSHGELPPSDVQAQLGQTLYNSWQRSIQSGLEFNEKRIPENILSGSILQLRIEQRHELIAIALPTMHYLYSFMTGSDSVILLSDHHGVIVHSVGDAEFIAKADRVLLKTGASWLEKHRGTNAIGTALVERSAVSVNGSEHFLESNSFLSCTAAPIFQPDGKISGILDISTHKNTFHPHTIGLVKTTVHAIEKQLFSANESQYALVLRIHNTIEGLGSLGEGMIGVDEAGIIVGIDRVALTLLKVNSIDIGQVKIQQILDISLSTIFDHAKRDSHRIHEVRTFHRNSLFFRFALSSSYKNHTRAQEAYSQEFDSYANSTSKATTLDDMASSNHPDFNQLKQFHKIAIQKAVEKTNGNISQAAKLLGISRNTLYRHLRPE